eukprot:895515-Ditylum_brightwellii.AAC.1
MNEWSVLSTFCVGDWRCVDWRVADVSVSVGFDGSRTYVSAAPLDSPSGTPSEAPSGACLGGVVGLRMSGISVPRHSKRG